MRLHMVFWETARMATGKFLIALVVLWFGWTFASSAQTARRLGDLNGDGLLTTLDYALLLDHINATNGNRTAPYPGSTNQLPLRLLGYADITGDGLLDTNDLHRLVDG